jgi:predicted deacetylase
MKMLFQPKYLIRFDDLCPTMNWDVWSKIESVLLEFSISPLLAVVPDNQDKKLVVGPANLDFWDNVRQWQSRGWPIGLHGYQHLYVTHDAGIAGIQKRSEFAGLPADVQLQKLRRAIDIFRSQSIQPRIWIAPAHSFDLITVTSLHRLGLKVISDGLAIAPYTDANGMFWVPQQLWRFRRRPFGVWTVCFHHNGWSAGQFEQFRRDVKRYRPWIADLRAITKEYEHRASSISDRCYSMAHSKALSLRASLAAST